MSLRLLKSCPLNNNSLAHLIDLAKQNNYIKLPFSWNILQFIKLYILTDQSQLFDSIMCVLSLNQIDTIIILMIAINKWIESILCINKSCWLYLM